MRNRLQLTAFIVLFTHALLSAGEHWKNYSINNIPWTDAKAVAAFNGQLLVAGKTSVAGGWGTENLWRMDPNATTQTWAAVPLPPPAASYNRAIHSFCEHNKALYGFEVEIATVGGSQYFASRRILKSADGFAWYRTDPGTFNNTIGSFSDSISFNGFLYVGDFDGHVWRSDGIGQTTTWTPVTLPIAAGSGQNRVVSFSKHQNYLYVVCQINDPVFPTTFIFSSADGSVWNWVYNPPSTEQFRPGTLTYNNALYWAGNHLLRTTGSPPYGGPWESINAGVLPVPFVLNNQLHVFGPTSQVLVSQSDGSWEPADLDRIGSCVTNSPKYPGAATIGNFTFLLPCDLIGIQNGIYSAAALNVPASTPRAGDRDVPVLGFRLNVNFGDVVSRLEIRNVAQLPAEPNSDIESLYIYRFDDNRGKVSQLIFDEQRDAWRLPDNFQLPIKDLDEFQIVADIAPSARSGRSCHFQIASDGIQTHNRPNFIGTTIQSSTIQTIENPALAAPVNIAGVETAPNPARDIVHFFYTLDTTSDVEIKIFDRAGRQIEEILETGKNSANRASSVWNAANVAPGLYFARVRIKSSGGERTHKTQIVIER